MNTTTTSARQRRADSPGAAERMLLVARLCGRRLAPSLVTFTLVTMFGHKQEARTPFVRVAELNEISVDPRPGARNWPHQFDGWKATAGDKFYGGRARCPRASSRPAPGSSGSTRGTPSASTTARPAGTPTCSTTRASPNASPEAPGRRVPALPRLRTRCSTARPASRPWASRRRAALAADFNMPAVIRGFQELSTKPYAEVLAMLTAGLPDGTPDGNQPIFPQAPLGGFTGETSPCPRRPLRRWARRTPSVASTATTRPDHESARHAPGLHARDRRHSRPERRTVPHMPSIEKWRRGDREKPYDPNEPTRRARRCARSSAASATSSTTAPPRTRSQFPWGNGLKADRQLEAFWEDKKFPDGTAFFDYKHGETGAEVFKAQHPEFELWSQGVHARAA
jgi:nitrite reductase (cytochrome c-552)